MKARLAIALFVLFAGWGLWMLAAPTSAPRVEDVTQTAGADTSDDEVDRRLPVHRTSDPIESSKPPPASAPASSASVSRQVVVPEEFRVLVHDVWGEALISVKLDFEWRPLATTEAIGIEIQPSKDEAPVTSQVSPEIVAALERVTASGPLHGRPTGTAARSFGLGAHAPGLAELSKLEAATELVVGRLTAEDPDRKLFVPVRLADLLAGDTFTVEFARRVEVVVPVRSATRGVPDPSRMTVTIAKRSPPPRSGDPWIGVHAEDGFLFPPDGRGPGRIDLDVLADAFPLTLEIAAADFETKRIIIDAPEAREDRERFTTDQVELDYVGELVRAQVLLGGSTPLPDFEVMLARDGHRYLTTSTDASGHIDYPRELLGSESLWIGSGIGPGSYDVRPRGSPPVFDLQSAILEIEVDPGALDEGFKPGRVGIELLSEGGVRFRSEELLEMQVQHSNFGWPDVRPVRMVIPAGEIVRVEALTSFASSDGGGAMARGELGDVLAGEVRPIVLRPELGLEGRAILQLAGGSGSFSLNRRHIGVALDAMNVLGKLKYGEELHLPPGIYVARAEENPKADVVPRFMTTTFEVRPGELTIVDVPAVPSGTVRLTLDCGAGHRSSTHSFTPRWIGPGGNMTVALDWTRIDEEASPRRTVKCGGVFEVGALPSVPLQLILQGPGGLRFETEVTPSPEGTALRFVCE